MSRAASVSTRTRRGGASVSVDTWRGSAETFADADSVRAFVSFDWRGTIRANAPVVVYRERRGGWLGKVSDWFSGRKVRQKDEQHSRSADSEQET